MFLKCMRQALFVLWYLTLNDSILLPFDVQVHNNCCSKYVCFPPSLSHFVLVMNKAL